MGPDSDSYYDGSRMLLGITEYSGIPIDLVSLGLLQAQVVFLYSRSRCTCRYILT